MPSFASYDGTEIGYHVLGDGPPLVCLPGGPGRAAEYLGISVASAARDGYISWTPEASGRPPIRRIRRRSAWIGWSRTWNRSVPGWAWTGSTCSRTRRAPSSGPGTVAAHPERLSRLLLITPGLAAVGVGGTDEQFRAVLERRAAESWYPTALAALEKIMAGDRSLAAFGASRPLFYGRWDDAAQAHATVGISDRHHDAREGYFAGAALDPDAIRATLSKLTAPVLLYVGELDSLVTPAMAREAAPMYNDATVIVQPGAAHYPWVDDPAAFTAAVGSFLA